MREIKFRAWDGETMSEPCNMWLREDHFIEWLNNFPYPDTIFMQFTGLKDKNGKEIYEGDILLDSDYGQSKRALAVVTYQGSGFVSHKPKPSTVWYEWCPIRDQEGSDWEIIGNIYENPELLKEKK